MSAKRQKAYYARQRQKGLKRVIVWVHESREAELKQVAERMKEPR